MIQDITPHIMHNEFTHKAPKPTDIVFGYDGNNVLLKKDQSFFHIQDLKEIPSLTYLCSIDDTSFYLGNIQPDTYISLNTYHLREYQPRYLAFACITGHQVYSWMKNNHYCGRCGHEMHKDEKERAMRCSSCGNIVYPKIMPAVIVGVLNENHELLITKYAHGRYQKDALVAGFNEIGETIEQTVIREVKEEVGLDVEHLTYYGSQPWGFTSTLLFGFFAHVKGSTDIHLQEEELSVARWVKQNDVIETGGNASLTSEMIQYFRKGNI